jgi:hypothetical protein
MKNVRRGEIHRIVGKFSPIGFYSFFMSEQRFRAASADYNDL